jgi:uncharacterized protein (TIGR01777 family)
MSKQVVLIAGGSGLIGSHLARWLTQDGYSVRILSRNKKYNADGFFHWDPYAGWMDEQALIETNVIVNLSGANVFSHRWNERRKEEIIRSRMLPVRVLGHYLNRYPHRVKTFINASAIGIYPKNHQQMMDENARAGDDFLAQTVRQWEATVMQAIGSTSIRLVIMRLGVVLSADGGALKELLKPLASGIIPQAGNGQQRMSWIHIDDLCRAVIFIIEQNTIAGVYNLTAPTPITTGQLIEEICRILNKRCLKIPIPASLLYLLLGQRASLLLDSLSVSSEKWQKTGFHFRYPMLSQALHHLLKSSF